MVVEADAVAATLRLVIPGFVALSVFYWLGLAVRRADWRWLLWSLLASVPLTWFGEWLASLLGADDTDLAKAVAECGTKAVRDADGSVAEVRAAIAGCVDSSLADHNALLSLIIAVIAAALAGYAAAKLWRRIVARKPGLWTRVQPLAWAAVLRNGEWLMVKLEDRIFVGQNTHVSDPVEVDAGDLDLYLTKVSLWTEGGLFPLKEVKGLLVRREDIKWLQVLVPDMSESSPSEAREPQATKA